MTEQTEWVPAFEGQRPPFQPGNEYRVRPGNQLAVKSGAWSPAHVDPRADEILKELASDGEFEYLAQPGYAATVRNWAVTQARCELFSEWLFAKPIDDQLHPPQGGARAPLEVWLSMVRTSAALADKLGLTPLARARLGRDVAAAQVLAQERLLGWIDRGPEMAARDQSAT